MNDTLPPEFMGADAPFPLYELSPFLQRREAVFLLSEDFTQFSRRIIDLFDQISAGTEHGRSFSAYFGRYTEHLTFSSGADLASKMTSAEGWAVYSADFYFKIDEGDAFGYNSARDNLGLITVDRDLLTDPDAELARWDMAFAEYLSTAGIGFGEAGRAYARTLLAQLPEWRSARLLPWVG